jgi:hypothetical protein
VALAVCLSAGIVLVLLAVKKGNVIPPFWAGALRRTPAPAN